MAIKEFDYKLLGQRIQDARNRVHLTQDEVASKVGYASKYMSKVETGVSKPSLDLLTKLSEALDVSLDELVRDSKHISNVVLNARIAELFNQLDETGKQLAITNLETMVALQAAKK